MRLEFTDDQLAVREVFAGFFANESAIEVVRGAEPLGFDARLWAKLVSTGAPGMAVAAELGGGGASLMDLAIVVAEAGSRLAPVPLVEHAVTARLLARIAPEHPLAGAAIAGDKIVTLALRPLVDGVAELCPGGAIADAVVALDAGSVLVIESTAPGEGPATTFPIAAADRSSDGASTLAAGDHARLAHTRALAEWKALTAVYVTVLGRRALQLGVEYVMEREQFDVPVGSFQAVQHGLASASVSIEGATLLANKAVWALDSDQPDANELAAMAYLFCTEAAQGAAAASLQYHGGYGYAEEYDIQLYYRAAKTLTLIAGSPGSHYQALADELLGAS